MYWIMIVHMIIVQNTIVLRIVVFLTIVIQIISK